MHTFYFSILFLLTFMSSDFGYCLKAETEKILSEQSYNSYMDRMFNLFSFRLTNDQAFISNREIDDSARKIIAENPAYHDRLLENLTYGTLGIGLANLLGGSNPVLEANWKRFVNWYAKISTTN